MSESETPWFSVPVRVRYCETDAMGFLHHSNYFNFFELSRTELFRAGGGDYRDMEARGFFFVVVHIECDFKNSCRFDDELTIQVRVARLTPAKLEHEYQVLKGSQLMAKGRSVLACVDRQGQVRRITDDVMYGPRMNVSHNSRPG